MNDHSQSLVMLVGALKSEGIASTLSAAGTPYKLKLLASTAENWETIVDLFRGNEISCAVVKFTGYDFQRFSRFNYEPARDELLNQISKNRHIVFLHDSLLGEKEPSVPTESQLEPELFPSVGSVGTPLYDFPFYSPSPEERIKAHALFRKYELNIVSYTRNAEVTVMATDFINDSGAGLLFRLYVPSGRMWANEIDRMLSLFREYLSKVGHRKVRLDQQRTGNGSVYCFYSGDELGSGAEFTVAQEFQNFTTLLDLCISDSSAAEKLLKERDIRPNEITEILTRFGKEARRLHLDLRHERDQKMLAIRQQLESELVDANVNLSDVFALADTVVPQSEGFRTIGSPTALAVSNSQLTLNVNSTVVDAVNAVVARNIEGTVHLGPEDNRILALIQQHGGQKSAELVSCLHELADKSAPKSQRLSSKQKLTSFLKQIGGKAQDVGVGLLVAYLSKLYGFN